MRLIACSLMALCTATSVCAQTSSERSEPFVSQMPRNDWGEPMYWLEMRSVIGWEKIMPSLAMPPTVQSAKDWQPSPVWTPRIVNFVAARPTSGDQYAICNLPSRLN